MPAEATQHGPIVLNASASAPQEAAVALACPHHQSEMTLGCSFFATCQDHPAGVGLNV